MKHITGGVTAAKGFEAAGAEAQVKYQNRKDMAMVFSRTPCRAAGVFTSNVVKAAPVVWDREIVENASAVHAVVVNSGIANACTGEQGREYCRQTAFAAAEALGIPETSVLVASTGVIGMQLPMDRITAGVKALAGTLSDTVDAGREAAEAIMTTDTHSKQVAVTIELSGKTVTIGGMAKGSGMIHPNMCTMLGFVTTDAAISKELLQEALRADVVDTFNMISVDGDTSTNDTLLVLANGCAGNEEITEKNEDYRTFCEALHEVNMTLAKMLAGDGEGATALFECRVIHADTKENARTLAKSVICSSLTKAAIFGHDAKTECTAVLRSREIPAPKRSESAPFFHHNPGSHAVSHALRTVLPAAPPHVHRIRYRSGYHWSRYNNIFLPTERSPDLPSRGPAGKDKRGFLPGL